MWEAGKYRPEGKRVASLGLLLLVGCVEPPGAARIIGPDGTVMLYVHCAGEQVACFQIAGDHCPEGYDLSPVFDPHDGNFLVRCRQAPVTSVASNPAPRAATAPRPAAAAARDGWPPTEVARPSEPWPTPASSGVPPAQPSANGSVDIDIGY